MARKKSFLTLVCGIFAQKGTEKYVSTHFFSYNSIVKTLRMSNLNIINYVR